MSCFESADESAHYGFSVCMLLTQYREALRWDDGGVVELGTGNATAIADVVAGMPGLRVHGYDISVPSVERARENIAARGYWTADTKAAKATRAAFERAWFGDRKGPDVGRL